MSEKAETEGFDWNSLDDEGDFAEEVTQNVTEKVEEPVAEPEEIAETGEVEEEVTEQTPLLKRPLTPEEQSFKDKYYDSLSKLEALQNKVLTAGDPVKPEVTDQEEDLEELIKANWGEDPALLQMARTNKMLVSRLKEQEGYETQLTANTVYDTIENFAKSNKELLKNVEIADRFVDDINDRLGAEFDTVVKQALAGKKFDRKFIEALPKKLERALTFATGKQTNPAKKAQADANISKRADKPVGINTKAAASQAAQPPSPARSSYKEALARARQGSTGRK